MFKNKKNKIISFLICFLFIVSLISIKTSKVEADDVVRTEPSFELRYTVGQDVEGSPNTKMVSGIVNNDITISGEITGRDFQLDYPEKELVLVLDVSESMNESVKGSGDNCKLDSKGICKTHKDANDPSKGAANHPAKYENTKINKLKDAAKEFINTLSNGKEGIQSVKNLKIAIVSYNSNGSSVLTNGFIDSSNATDLNTAINKLEVSKDKNVKNGTNTGEGLRKALYILNKDNTKAKKSIVLMSDGLPTYCTVVDTNLIDKDGKKVPNYYKDITTEKAGVIWNSGSGLSDVYGFDLGYAKEMAKIVKEKNYKVYSIGYGLNDSGNKNLRSLHSEMLQTPMPDNNNNDESFGYYKANDKIDSSGNGKNYAIYDVFKKIADDLVKEYNLMDSKLEMTGIEDSIFTLSILDHKINLSGLKYIIKEKTATKIIYSLEKPVTFSYTINSDKVLVNEALYKSININYKWNSENKTADLDKYILVNLSTEAQRLTHGLYNGFENGQPIIDENGGKEFNVTPGATYNFGSSFMLNVKNIDVVLDIDENIIANKDDIVAYKVENGKLVKLTSTEVSKVTSGTNSYNIKLNGDKDGITNTTEILIVYKGVVKSDINAKISLTNNITISKSSKKVYMTTPSIKDEPKLPDLF